MKKLFSLLMIAVLGFFVISCTTDDSRDNNYQDNDTYPIVVDVNASFHNVNGTYTISRTFNSPIPATDVILVYRKSGMDGSNTIWQQIPRTMFLNEGELDYDFDFTRADVAIYAGGDIDIAAQNATFMSNYINNQTFRVVFVPASTGKAAVDYSDYNAVIKFYGIDDSKVSKL